MSFLVPFFFFNIDTHIGFMIWGFSYYCWSMSGNLSRSCQGLAQSRFHSAWFNFFFSFISLIICDNLTGNLKLRVRERPDDTVFVEGLMECYVTSEQDVFDLMQRGQSQRSGT
jgi:hypothetical protein